VWGAQWVFLLPAIYSRRRGHLLPPAATDLATWRLVIAVGGFEVIGFLGLESGIRHAPIVVVSPVASTSALVTVLIGYFWLEEDVPLRSLLLAAVVVSGIVCVGVG
jgi:drug/metabolite transporter (DMT)-like permease